MPFEYVVVGDTNVGKSSLIARFQGATFYNEHIPTVGVDFQMKTIEVEKKPYKLRLWDTPGQKRFQSTNEGYFHSVHAFLLVFDLTDLESFKNTKKHLDSIKEHCSNKNVSTILVGNKLDSDDKDKVKGLSERAKAFARANKIDYVEASAKTGANVNEIFMGITTKLLNQSQPKNEEVKEVKETQVNKLSEEMVIKTDARTKKQNIILAVAFVAVCVASPWIVAVSPWLLAGLLVSLVGVMAYRHYQSKKPKQCITVVNGEKIGGSTFAFFKWPKAKPGLLPNMTPPVQSTNVIVTPPAALPTQHTTPKKLTMMA